MKRDRKICTRTLNSIPDIGFVCAMWVRISVCSGLVLCCLLYCKPGQTVSYYYICKYTQRLLKPQEHPIKLKCFDLFGWEALYKSKVLIFLLLWINEMCAWDQLSSRMASLRLIEKKFNAPTLYVYRTPSINLVGSGGSSSCNNR